jgi:O-antigen ligase
VKASGLLPRSSLTWNGRLITLLGMSLAVLAGLSLTWLSPLEGIAFVGLCAVLIGALIEPFVGLAAALFLGLLKAYLSAEVPQIPAQIGHVFVALALASWLMRGLSERDVRIHHARSALFVPLLAFLGTVLLSLWDAVVLIAYGIPELVKWAEILLLYILVKEHLTKHAAPSATGGPADAETKLATQRLRWLVVVLLGTGAFQALVGIWQFGLRGEGPEHFRILGGDFFRAYVTFEPPNPYAGYLGLTLALALGVVIDATRRALMRWYTERSGGANASQPSSRSPLCQPVGLPLYVFSGGTVGVMLVALLASWSRGAWIGFGAAVLAMAAALPRKTIWSVLLVILLIVGGAGLYASGQLPASFVARLTAFVQDIRLEDVRGVPINDANYAVVERLAHWQAALSMMRHHLWTGIGFGCYEAAYPTFALINWPIALGHAHNIYLNFAAETGLLGLGAYLILWVVVFWQTWRATRRARGLTRGLAVGLLGAWTHVSVHHLLDNLYVNNVHLHIGVLLGLAAFINHQTNQMTSTHDR